MANNALYVTETRARRAYRRIEMRNKHELAEEARARGIKRKSHYPDRVQKAKTQRRSSDGRMARGRHQVGGADGTDADVCEL